MKRQVAIGPEQIDASLGVLDDYLGELKAHGAPDDAKVRIETQPNGETLTVNVAYEEEVGPFSTEDQPEVYSRRRGHAHS
jgi:hypothetical protein